MDKRDITSANAEMLYEDNLSVLVPVSVQGFSVDSMAVFPERTVVETQMGVDGRLTGGKIKTEYDVEVDLQADSPTLKLLRNSQKISEVTGVPVKPKLTFIIPATGQIIIFDRGFTVAWKDSDIKKVLEPAKFKHKFEIRKEV